MTRIEFINMLFKKYEGAPFRTAINIVDAPHVVIQYARDNEWDDEDYKKFWEEFEENNIRSF